ncbi:MAG TPA: hypothetical protein VMX17_04675 [Candidatus Glassbacteria bacterium]|nr:hypothetical protein [Candidatus Glassbacteria bacterium]
MSNKPYEEAVVIMHGSFTPNKELVKTLLKKSEETQGQRTMNIYCVDAGKYEWGMLCGAIVVAADENAARKLASKECGREGEDAWRDAKCELLGITTEDCDSDPRTVLIDFYNP